MGDSDLSASELRNQYLAGGNYIFARASVRTVFPFFSAKSVTFPLLSFKDHCQILNSRHHNFGHGMELPVTKQVRVYNIFSVSRNNSCMCATYRLLNPRGYNRVQWRNHGCSSCWHSFISCCWVQLLRNDKESR